MVLPRQEDVIQKWIGKLKDLADSILYADLFCDEDQEDWVQLECGTELGGVIAIGLIKPGVDVGAMERKVAIEDVEMGQVVTCHWSFVTCR